MTKLITQDGTCIIIDPEVGEVSVRTQEEAEAELQKRRAYQNIRKGAVHRHPHSISRSGWSA